MEKIKPKTYGELRLMHINIYNDYEKFVELFPTFILRNMAFFSNKKDESEKLSTYSRFFDFKIFYKYSKELENNLDSARNKKIEDIQTDLNKSRSKLKSLEAELEVVQSKVKGIEKGREDAKLKALKRGIQILNSNIERLEDDLKKAKEYSQLSEIEKIQRYAPGLPMALEYIQGYKLIDEESYNKLSEDEQLKLEMLILKDRAVMKARLANLYNRLAHDKDRGYFSNKNTYMQEFLSNAIKYNEIATQLGFKDDQIVFGFSVDGYYDEKYGKYAGEPRMALEASLPGFTRLSLHFGYFSNFKGICENVNKIVGTSFKVDDIIEDRGKYAYDVKKEFCYNLPQYGVKNTGIIQSAPTIWDCGELARQFRKKAKDKYGKINHNGMEEFIYYMVTPSNLGGTELSDLELFQLAEFAGLGKGFLEELKVILEERKKIKENMKSLTDKKFISIDEVYVKQRLDLANNNKEEIQILLNGLWNCIEMKANNKINKVHIQTFKGYLCRLVEQNKDTTELQMKQIDEFCEHLNKIISWKENGVWDDMAYQFEKKAIDKYGKINHNGMEEFIYCMDTNVQDMSNSEIYELAEYALGSESLGELEKILDQRTIMQKRAAEENMDIDKFYVRQRLSEAKDKKEAVRTLVDGLWECKKMECYDEISIEDINDFKKYLKDLLKGIEGKDINLQDCYFQLLEIVSSEDINLEELEKEEREEDALITQEQGKAKS